MTDTLQEAIERLRHAQVGTVVWDYEREHRIVEVFERDRALILEALGAGARLAETLTQYRQSEDRPLWMHAEYKAAERAFLRAFREEPE